MNKEYILQLIKPYIDGDSNLEEKKYEEFFGSLESYQHEELHEILEESGINIVKGATKTNKKQKRSAKNLRYKGLENITNEQLCVLYQQGYDEALELLFIKNEGLVYSRAYKYDKKYKHKLDMDDLAQFGFIGMIDAAKKFDIKLGNKFTTYAIYWIDQKITRGITDEGYTIRIPVHMFEQVIKVQNFYRRHEGLEKIEIKEKILKEFNYDETKLNELLNLATQMISMTSLHTPVGEAQDSILMDFLENDDHFDVEEEVEHIMLKELINEMLLTLSPKEKDIIDRRFGLNGYEFHTLEQIGLEYDVTRERIRQIEAKALRRLRHPTRNRKLRGYLE